MPASDRPDDLPDCPPDCPVEQLTFEQAMAELEGLIERIEQGDMGLEDALAARKRGDLLVRRCRGILEAAEQELRVVAPGASDEAAG
jgi:exodeoxyribonuclease VII small subunit